MRPPQRFITFACAFVLAALIVGLGATSFQRKVESFQPLGFVADAQPGGFRVLSVTHPATSLSVGDEIMLIDGLEPTDLQALRHQSESMVMVRRGAELEEALYKRPPLEIDFAYLIMAMIGVAYLLIGLLTVLKADRSPAGLFYLWALTAAALYLLSPPREVLDFTSQLIFGVDQLARNLLPALTLHLFMIFPAPPSGRWRRCIPFVYLPAAVLLALRADWMLNQGRWIAGAPTPERLRAFDSLELFLLAATSLLAVVIMALRLRRRERDWTPKRQVQWILLGMAGGYLPFLALYVLPTALRLHPPSWTVPFAILPLGLVPLAFAYSILKYKLWDLGVILRNSVSYTVTALVALFGFALIQLAIDRGLPSDQTLARNLLTFTAVMAIAGLMVPTRGVVSSGLERLQYRGSYSKRRALAEFGREVLYEKDLGSLSANLLQRLSEGLEVDRIDLYLATGSGLRSVGASDGPRHLPYTVFGDDFWLRSVQGISAIALPGERPSEEQQLFASGFRYAFPLTVRNRGIGLVVAGYKLSEQPLSGEDIDLASGLLSQAALGIENARLLDEVHQQLEEVTRLKEHNRGILESSPAGIAVIDDHDGIRYANRAFGEIFATEPESIKGTPLVQLLPVSPLPSTGEGPIEASFCDLEGNEHYFQISIANFRREAARGRLRVLVVHDVSDHMLMQIQLSEKERLASLGMLAAGVAHEVNTPLTGISSYAQLLLDETDRDNPHYDILKKMERQTFRASQIVNNLLDFARNRQDALTPISVSSVVEGCVRELEGRARESLVEIGWRSSAEKLEVLGHEGELHQVVTNLMVNAIEAMAPRGGGRLDLDLESTPQRIRLRVVDTGPGVAQERLERIFQPFFSSKLGHGGSGLGLAITANIVQRHGGQIHAESSPGEGCTFIVELPRC